MCRHKEDLKIEGFSTLLQESCAYKLFSNMSLPATCAIGQSSLLIYMTPE